MLNSDQTITQHPMKVITQRTGRLPLAVASGRMPTQMAMSDRISAGHVINLRSSISLIGPVPIVLFAELACGFLHVVHDFAEDVDIAANRSRVNLELIRFRRALPEENAANPATH
jgi:hypothetical protein